MICFFCHTPIKNSATIIHIIGVRGMEQAHTRCLKGGESMKGANKQKKELKKKKAVKAKKK